MNMEHAYGKENTPEPAALHALIVEDAPADAELMVMRLAQEGFRLDWQRVQSEAEYLAALETHPDLILSDWSLPQFSGLRALQILRERGLATPFIIISGSIGEEAAITALRQGADDYVLKDRPGRLGQAVRSSLERAKLSEEQQQIDDTLFFLAQHGWVASSEGFFQALARFLAEKLKMDYVCIDRLEGEGRSAQTEAIYFDGRFDDNVSYTLKDTPCGDVLGKTICSFARGVRHLFPKDAVLQEMCAESYIGTTLWSSSGQPIGLIALIGRQPLENLHTAESMLKLVAVRAAGELERKKAQEEKEKLQEQLLRAQKMESVGRLAGGVAHDFNNLTSVIMGRAETALAKISPEQAVYHDLQEILKAAQRSADLTRQLLAFARKQTISPLVLDLNVTISSMFEMFQRLIGEEIDLMWQPTPDVWHVQIDPSQIDQILANLLVNARDAIDGVGTVTIETSNVVIDKAASSARPGLAAGEYAMLAVSDSGSGMDRETLAHLFEPFFTTKETGKGTGLGLATVYGIIRQNNGYIDVRSEPGRGTTFRVYLPRVDAEVTPAIVSETVETPRGKAELVLIVEDVEALLELAQETLEERGYMVLAASSPAEALRLAQENAGKISLLITDVVMPEMNGRVLSEKLNAIQPGLKCLFMSGYTADIISDHGVLPEGVFFIQKPFLLEDLAARVYEALKR
jgi:signal transduction histidine kinase/DNA-binding response OmpR family regulator